MRKLKVGDRVRIINSIYDFDSVGDMLTIGRLGYTIFFVDVSTHPNRDKMPYYMLQEREVCYLYDQVELVVEPIEPTTKEDVVNHPSHYTTGMECIDEMVMIFGTASVKSFCKCNAWKYRKRAMLKGGQEDLDKADWYIAKYKELDDLEKKQYNLSF